MNVQSINNNNTDRTLDVVFSRFRGFSFTITLRQKHKRVPRRQRMLSLCLVIQSCCAELLWASVSRIVNEKPLNLEKTTSSGLSVLLLIYGTKVHGDIPVVCILFRALQYAYSIFIFLCVRVKILHQTII